MSHQSIRSNCAIVASSLVVLGTAIASPVSAQAIQQQQTGVVGRVVVQGNERIDAQTIGSYLPIAQGETVDPAKIDLAVKTLFRTDLFADVQITLNGTDLVVKVVENPIVNQVVFEGNHALTETKLRDEVTIHPRAIFTKSRVQQDVARIIELYRRAGRINATVTPKIVELPQKRVDLVFEIDEGPKTGVSRVNLLGNKAFSNSELRDVIVTKESQWWRFLSSNTNYDPDRIDYDREQLRKFYMNRGYYDFRVVSAVAELTPNQKNFAVTFTVDEGAKYKFGEMSVTTENKKLDANFLKALLPIRKGQMFRSDGVDNAVDALTYASGSAGYAFVDVRPKFTPHRDKRTVDVTFDVREGPHVYVERIDVIGNTRTIDPVIRREMLLSEGDAYNKVLLDRSRNAVRGLGFFKDVAVQNLPGSAPDKTVVQVKVEEQPTGELSFGVGFSTVEKFLVDVGVTERNFRGRGQQLTLRAETGALSQQVQFSFTEPRWLGRHLAAGWDVYDYRYDFANQASFTTTQAGAGVHLGFPVNANTYLTGTYKLQTSGVQLSDLQCPAEVSLQTNPILCEQRGNFLTSLLGYSLKTDRRNDPVFPTRGWKGEFDQDFAGFGGQVKYIRTQATATAYFGFTKRWVLTFVGNAGYIRGWGGDSVRINDRFFMGGNTFRGFQVAGIGPRDLQTTTQDALGGNAFAIGTVEFAFPNGLPEEYGIHTALFTDFGTEGIVDPIYKKVISDPSLVENIRDDLALRASAGLSVKWKSPMGPVQFDFSQILSKTTYDKTELFRFSTFSNF
jgi:outer membrane protein insertion porin family